MSEDSEADISRCASCGIAAVDDIELKECDGCDLVKYCSDACKELHRPEHAGNCSKRAAELRDELLFKQPESSCYGDCPLCMLPLPLDLDKPKCSRMGCCSKLVCKGCARANHLRLHEAKLEQRCPFCRKPTPKTEEEGFRQNMNRIKANDPVALHQQGVASFLKGDCIRAFRSLTKAAALGYAEAHYNLACLYHDGQGVEKDESKMMYHWEEAAIAGHPDARYNLGAYEWSNYNNDERAVKHYVIAATQGHDESIKALMDLFRHGCVSKEELASALRAHQAAVEATKSPQRLAAEEAGW